MNTTVMLVPQPPAWPEVGEWPDTRRNRRRLASGMPRFQVAFRIEPPEGRLAEFGDRLIALTGKGELAERLPEHRAMYLYFQHVAPDAVRAVDACTYQVRRFVKRIGIPPVRVTADTREIVTPPLKENDR